MAKFKQIKLLPSEFTLDVWIGTYKEIWPIYKSYYEITDEDELGLKPNEVGTITPCLGNKKLKEIRIAIKLVSLDNKNILVHEIIHILWHLANKVGYKMVYDSQEWQAVLAEWLYKEILKDNYGKLPE
jgi:hypothetical protein